MPISRGRVFFLCLPLSLSARDSAHIPPPYSAPLSSRQIPIAPISARSARISPAVWHISPLHSPARPMGSPIISNSWGKRSIIRRTIQGQARSRASIHVSAAHISTPHGTSATQRTIDNHLAINNPNHPHSTPANPLNHQVHRFFCLSPNKVFGIPHVLYHTCIVLVSST